MDDILKDTDTLLSAIEVEIRREAFRKAARSRRILAWSRAGIAVVTRLKLRSNSIPGAGKTSMIVVTPHAHAVGWLLDRIDGAFAPLFDRSLRWDFFDRIAEAMDEYSLVVPPSKDTDVNILRVVLREARDILSEMAEGEFPYMPGLQDEHAGGDS